MSAPVRLVALVLSFPSVAVAQGAQPQQAPPGPPPAGYYQQPAGPAQGPPAGAPAAGVYEPPPPGHGPAPMLVYEPPPPPKPRHRAPKESLWIGARAGWFIPFGDLWGRCRIDARGYETCDVRSWRDFASSGTLWELDAGARLGRRTNLFLLWEHGSLGRGEDFKGANGGQEFGTTEYYALGIRHSSNPSTVGFASEIGIGYRTAKAKWKDGTELELASFPLELRIGLGADIRLADMFAISPLVTLGGGVFTEAELRGPNGSAVPGRTRDDQSGTHSWVTFQLGAHFDLFGSR